MSTDSRHRPRRRRLLAWTTGLIAVAVLAAGAFAFWFLRDDSPDEVTIGDAAAQVVDDSDDSDDIGSVATTSPSSSAAVSDGTSATASPSATTSEGATDITGTWGVDTSIGEFSYEDSTGTFVGFRIAEELANIGSTEAVGRTPVVTGTLVAEGATITEVAIEADMTAITTNESRRDDKVQRALETDLHPTATFTLTEPIELDEAALSGDAVVVDAVGDLTIHGVTRAVTIPLEAQLVGDTIVVVGSLDIQFADFGVEVPSAPVVVSVDDHGPLELQLFFTR